MLCPIYISGNYTGLSIDVGFTDCMVLPIYDGNPQISSFKFGPASGLTVFRDLLDYLRRDNIGKSGGLYYIDQQKKYQQNIILSKFL